MSDEFDGWDDLSDPIREIVKDRHVDRDGCVLSLLQLAGQDPDLEEEAVFTAVRVHHEYTEEDEDFWSLLIPEFLADLGEFRIAAWVAMTLEERASSAPLRGVLRWLCECYFAGVKPEEAPAQFQVRLFAMADLTHEESARYLVVQTLTLVARMSKVEYPGAASRLALEVHDLVQRYMREPDPRDSADRWQANLEHLRRIADWAPPEELARFSLLGLATDATNILGAQDGLKAFEEGRDDLRMRSVLEDALDIQRRSFGTSDAYFRLFASELIPILVRMGEHEAAQTLGAEYTAEDAWELRLIADIHTAIAGFGRIDPATVEQQTNTILDRTPDPASAATWLTSLAAVVFDPPEAAIALGRKALELTEDLDQENEEVRTARLTALLVIGGALRDLDAQEACEYLEEAYAQLRAGAPLQPSLRVRLYTDLMYVYACALGNLDARTFPAAAAEILAQARTLEAEVVDLIETLPFLHTMAQRRGLTGSVFQLARVVGDFTHAIEMCTRLLDEARADRTAPSSAGHLADIRYFLAIALLHRGQVLRARSVLKPTLETFDRILPPESARHRRRLHRLALPYAVYYWFNDRFLRPGIDRLGLPADTDLRVGPVPDGFVPGGVLRPIVQENSKEGPQTPPFRLHSGHGWTLHFIRPLIVYNLMFLAFFFTAASRFMHGPLNQTIVAAGFAATTMNLSLSALAGAYLRRNFHTTVTDRGVWDTRRFFLWREISSVRVRTGLLTEHVLLTRHQGKPIRLRHPRGRWLDLAPIRERASGHHGISLPETPARSVGSVTVDVLIPISALLVALSLVLNPFGL
ncbi:hypothetical protein [Actinocorallia aurantiaca]|uniref:Tetratricopeptide repeat protein n=1 Tax=Actinocorallia aurantiaca TaxID=46204 RepID=A0ABN3UEQ8_9ACTN